MQNGMKCLHSGTDEFAICNSASSVVAICWHGSMGLRRPANAHILAKVTASCDAIAMKGIVFSEMVTWAEAAFSPAIVDAMITRSGVPNDGAYTSVGNYPHGEALDLLVALSELTEQSVHVLARAYGHWLAGRFVELYPDLISIYPDAQSLLAGVENHIHLEVTKLYPEAKPPKVEALQTERGLQLEYGSHRPFADVAHGLIDGFIAHFGDKVTVEREDLVENGTSARFLISQTRS
jgi:hypothetical protein